jgi:hypothetical protein
MNGAGAGSHFLPDNAHPKEVLMDDDMMDNMDPSKLDKVEGKEARNKTVLD